MVELVVKQSKIHGRGVFAEESIKVRTIFYKVSLVNCIRYNKTGCAYVGDGKWLDDTKIINFVNHSCDANAVLETSDNNAMLIASKNIEKGEEISLEYNRTETNGMRQTCNCGSRNCKGYFLTL